MCLAKGVGWGGVGWGGVGWGWGWGWGGGSKDREQTLPLCYLEPGEYPESFEEGGGLKSD